jgi:hypothetical protein
MFQDRLAALEGAEACVATATGMAAITTMVFGLLKAGDHLVTARGVFGTVVPLLDQIAKKLGIETTWVRATDLDDWRRAVRPNTRLLYAESPSNPALEVVDIAASADIARKAGAILAVDNAVASPALQRPISFGADLVVHSATKYIEGQGRVLAGAIAGRRISSPGRSSSSCAPRDRRSRRTTPGPASREWRRSACACAGIAPMRWRSRAGSNRIPRSSACSIPRSSRTAARHRNEAAIRRRRGALVRRQGRP